VKCARSKRACEESFSGVQVHDARLAAAMIVHHIRHILTLNETDFSRFTEVTVVNLDSL
jgi:predicted nucleic acid-binding protein